LSHHAAEGACSRVEENRHFIGPARASVEKYEVVEAVAVEVMSQDHSRVCIGTNGERAHTAQAAVSPLVEEHGERICRSVGSSGVEARTIIEISCGNPHWSAAGDVE